MGILTIPDYFAPVIGQSPAIEILTQAVLQQRIAPAYLFAGAEGVGKKLTARCWLEMLLSHGQPESIGHLTRHQIRQDRHPDVLWIEPTYSHQGQLLSVAAATAAGLTKKAPPQIRIEQIRQISKFLAQPPLTADRAIVIVCQAETMTEGAANALLKTLEEPGSAVLILIASDRSSLMPTIVSRCQHIPFQRLSQQMTIDILTRLGHSELAAQTMAIGMAQGSPGQAITLWQQLQSIPTALKAELSAVPANLPQALRLARTIDRELDNSTQLALIDYLQNLYWQQYRNIEILNMLVASRHQLLTYVQPRLVWECLFLSIKMAK